MKVTVVQHESLESLKKRLILAFWVLVVSGHAWAGEQGAYQIPGTQIVPIEQSGAERHYELYIKLPESYSLNDDKNYPVIYFTDAVWHIELLSGSVQYLMEDAILVGISWQKDMKESLRKEVGDHVSRYRDYSTRQSNKPEHQAKYQFGQADNHLNFIRNDVIRFVESNYRTDPENRTYFGYSLGGRFGAYILLTQPSTFKNYILGSPSVKGEIAYFSALEEKETSKTEGLNANVFMSHGSLEHQLGADVEKFASLLKDREDTTLSVTQVVIDGSHQTAFPMTGIRSIAWLSNLHGGKEQ